MFMLIDLILRESVLSKKMNKIAYLIAKTFFNYMYNIYLNEDLN